MALPLPQNRRPLQLSQQPMTMRPLPTLQQGNPQALTTPPPSTPGGGGGAGTTQTLAPQGPGIPTPGSPNMPGALNFQKPGQFPGLNLPKGPMTMSPMVGGPGSLPSVPKPSDAMQAIDKREQDMLAQNEQSKAEALRLAEMQGAGFMRRADTMNAAMGRGFGGGMLGLGRQAMIGAQALGARTGLQYEEMAQDIKGRMLTERLTQGRHEDDQKLTEKGWAREDASKLSEAEQITYDDALARADAEYKRLTGDDQPMPPELLERYEEWAKQQQADNPGEEIYVREFFALPEVQQFVNAPRNQPDSKDGNTRRINGRKYTRKKKEGIWLWWDEYGNAAADLNDLVNADGR